MGLVLRSEDGVLNSMSLCHRRWFAVRKKICVTVGSRGIWGSWELGNSQERCEKGLACLSQGTMTKINGCHSEGFVCFKDGKNRAF